MFVFIAVVHILTSSDNVRASVSAHRTWEPGANNR